MEIAAGKRLGPHEILSLLGAGGMGEVYKARDTRLDRIVALKVLSPHLADRPEVRERFEREAKTIANLKHPHICVLYDIGQQDGIDYLVLEYLEGETLAQRLVKGPLPLEQVLQYATEIADALDKAHRAGVTHRDIKPGNIMLTKEGSKLLDFGLAKLKQEAAPIIPRSELPTGMGAPTAHGTILGTLQYMAPEQVEGKVDELDGRTDLFAFGAVVYEMATGKKAFEGKTQASVIAAILERDPPPMSSLQPMTPPLLDRLVKKCLAKEPEKRWQSARDLCDALKWIADAGSQAAAAAPVLARRKLWDRLGWVVAAIAIIVAVALAIPRFRPTSTTDTHAIRFSISPPGELDLIGHQLAVSPDGTHVAFVATDTSGKALIWVQSLDSPEAQPLAGTEGAAGPFWSPDSRSIGFVVDGKLKKIAASGGPVQTLANTATNRGATCNRNGVILFTTSSFGELESISEAGGVPSHVTTLDTTRGERGHRFPQFLPDGRHFLYSVQSAPRENSAIYVGSLDSKETKQVLNSDMLARYASPGFLFFMRDQMLMAQPFDAERLELTGEPSLVAESLWTNRTTGAAGFSVSERGVLAYWSGGTIGTRKLVWFDQAGKQLGTVGPPGNYKGLKLSPDGKQVAVDVINAQGSYDIWLSEVGREVTTRFTFDPAVDRLPLWSPDGSRIVFHSNRSTGVYDLYQKSSSGAGNEELLFQSGEAKYPRDWSRDGRFLVYSAIARQQGATADLWVLPLTGERKPSPFLKTEFQETQAQFSPDGRWMAYVSNESGRDEVYIQSFPHAWKQTAGLDRRRAPAPLAPRGERAFLYLAGPKTHGRAHQRRPSIRGGDSQSSFWGAFRSHRL